MKNWLLIIGLVLSLSLTSGAGVQAQQLRNLNKPYASQHQLTDTTEATRLFYLSLGQMPLTDALRFLENAGLTAQEAQIVINASSDFKKNHGVNASDYQKLANSTSNIEQDLVEYKQRADGLLHDLLGSLSISEKSLTILQKLIKTQMPFMKVYEFSFERTSEAPAPEAQSGRPRLLLVTIPPCPSGQSRQEVYNITGTLNGYTNASMTNFQNLSLTQVATGTYRVYATGVTACRPFPTPSYGWSLEINSVFNNGTTYTIDGAESFMGCIHATNGSLNLSSVSYTTNWSNPNAAGGTQDFNVLEWLNGVKKKMLEIKNFFEYANTWLITAASPSWTGTWWHYPTLESYCTNTALPDFYPTYADLSQPNYAYHHTGSFCSRTSTADDWTCFPKGIEWEGYPLSTSITRSICTKTGPQ